MQRAADTYDVCLLASHIPAIIAILLLQRYTAGFWGRSQHDPALADYRKPKRMRGRTWMTSCSTSDSTIANAASPTDATTREKICIVGCSNVNIQRHSKIAVPQNACNLQMLIPGKARSKVQHGHVCTDLRTSSHMQRL